MSGNAEARPGGRRLALLLEYDGTAYRGSQLQDNGTSIQAELEAAIERLTAEGARVSFAGRTDAGVHALGQVASFVTESVLPAAQFVSGLNHFLPRDIAVGACRDVALEFDPRRHAKNRVYRYRIENRAVRSPLLRERAWHVEKPLDISEMARTARQLEGAHDFAAFAGAYEGSTERTLRRCQVTAGCAVAGGRAKVTLEMEAQAFLPHQVRRTAGALVEVGLGRMTSDALVALLQPGAEGIAGPAAPACGLYLVKVEYEGLDFASGEQDGNGHGA